MSGPIRRVAIVGAGPGGLAAGMLLAHRGFDVTVYEQKSHVGGRNAELCLGPYRFDVGPTFLIMKWVLDSVFADAGRQSSQYMDFRRLDPMYELMFNGVSVRCTNDRQRMYQEVERAFPGEGAGLRRFYEQETRRFRYMYPCLEKPYGRLRDLLAPVFLRALPHLSLSKSLHDVLTGYFNAEVLRLAFTFQAKYLGMSPWECPGAFALMPFVEHAFGVEHIMGGLNRMSLAMAKAMGEDGGKLRLSTPVKQLIVDGRAVRGVVLEDGEKIEADTVVINADFGRAMTDLVPGGVLRKYRPDRLRRRPFSCSTFMMYLGVDTTYPLAHHTIVVASDYRKNVESVVRGEDVSADMSVYVRNATVTDPGLAPAGHSSLYVLVPVANNALGRIDWAQRRATLREQTLDVLEQRTCMKDLRAHIRQEQVITPMEWESDYSVFLGATFNLAHNLGQMLYLRPHNEFEELENCYLVGGGTHPGSGVPTILESARISSNLVCKRWGVDFPPSAPFPEEALQH
jgi:phytoene desaturase